MSAEDSDAHLMYGERMSLIHLHVAMDLLRSRLTSADTLHVMSCLFGRWPNAGARLCAELRRPACAVDLKSCSLMIRLA